MVAWASRAVAGVSNEDQVVRWEMLWSQKSKGDFDLILLFTHSEGDARIDTDDEMRLMTVWMGLYICTCV